MESRRQNAWRPDIVIAGHDMVNQIRILAVDAVERQRGEARG